MAEMEQNNGNSYKSILKGTSLLGGVQVFQILISLVRGKFVALLLGPDGMGINTLFVSSSNTITQVSNMGLSLAIVKETAEAGAEPDRLATVARVSRTIILAAALAGMLICMVCAPWLSQVTFGSADYGWQFMMLGAVVFLGVESTGITAMLQGLHKVKMIARSTLAGSIAGLALGVPMYYIWGKLGIVPALTVTSASMVTYQWLALRKALPDNRVKFSWQSHRPLVRKMIGLGLVMMSSSVIATLCGYLVNVLIRVMGNVDDVGLYGAANSLTMQYTTMVFSAMSMDYFPRLVTEAKDNARMRAIVNRQSEVIGFIIAPLVIMVILLAPVIIRVLLAKPFLVITPLVRWMALGVVFKAMAFPMGYIAYAKDNKRLFFWLEGVVGNVLFLAMAVTGYYLFGLPGMGYAMVCENVLLIMIYYVVNRVNYGYRLDSKASVAYLSTLGLTVVAFLGTLLADETTGYVVMAVCLAASAGLSAVRLRGMLRS